MGLFNRIQPDPGFVSPVRSDPGFVSPIRSDLIRSDPDFVNGHFQRTGSEKDDTQTSEEESITEPVNHNVH